MTDGPSFSAYADVSQQFFSPFPMALLSQVAAETHGLHLPTPVRLSHGNRSLAVWMLPSEHYRDHVGSPLLRKLPQCIVSRRTRAVLSVRDGDTLRIQCPPKVDVKVLPGLARDLPLSNEIHVGNALITALGMRRSLPLVKKYALLTYGDICAPVVLRNKAVKDGAVRVSMSGRLLFGNIKPGGSVQLANSSYAKITGPVGGSSWPRRILGTLDWALESALRLIFRAPEIALRTVQASIGDDRESIVRCSPELYPLLGIEQGDHILVAWGRKRAVAIALDTIVSDEPSETVFDAQSVERFQTPSHVPAHLVLRVTSPVRSALGMPASSVVTVRRRVTPFVFRRLGRATIPMAALAFAAFTVPSHHRLALVAVLAVILVLQLASLRYAGAPKGRWPR